MSLIREVKLAMAEVLGTPDRDSVTVIRNLKDQI
jgi:hypothetical protein